MGCYEARFGDVLCHVDIQAETSITDGPTYLATPMTVDADRPVLRWFADAHGEQVELPASSVAGALERATRFLERHVGRSLEPFHVVAPHSCSIEAPLDAH